jgi:hypothetical protein
VSKFKVGDRVVRDTPSLAEQPVTGISPVPVGTEGVVKTRHDGCRIEGYDVEFAGYETQWIRAASLRKIDDRPELTTWEAVHEVCGWLPGMGVRDVA